MTMATKRDFNDRDGQTRVVFWIPTALLAAYRGILADRAANVSADLRLHIKRTVEAQGKAKR